MAIVGGSGAGKSYLADNLARSLKGTRLSLDDFYRDRSHLSPARRALLNFDHPAAIDWLSVKRVLDRFLAGKPARVPQYDFTTHTRLRQWKWVRPGRVIVMDGLWLFHQRPLRSRFDVRIYVDCPKGIRLRRRLERDVRLRGRTRHSVLRQFRSTVEPSYLKHVKPQARWATILWDGQSNGRLVRQLAKQLTARVDPA